MLSTKTQIQNTPDDAYKELDLAGWGRLRIRSLSAKEVIDLCNEPIVIIACCKAAALSIVDQDGNRMFESADELGDKSFVRMLELYNQIMAFNGLGGEAKEKN